MNFEDEELLNKFLEMEMLIKEMKQEKKKIEMLHGEELSGRVMEKN